MSGERTPPPVRIAHLSLRYRERLAFEDVSLEIPSGSITALVGPSGSGKSSLLRCLNRLVDLVAGTVVTGRVEIGEVGILGEGIDLLALRRRVGMVFQVPHVFALSIRRNLELPLEERGVADAGERDRRIRKALEEVGLAREVEGRLEEPAGRLSGGQKQRLCLARALVLEPEVLLLDEPTASLDVLSAGVVEETIGRLRGRYTVVLVTHNLAQARRLADRVAVLWWQDGAGRLVEVGSVKEVFETPRQAVTREYVEGRRG